MSRSVDFALEQQELIHTHCECPACYPQPWDMYLNEIKEQKEQAAA